MRASMCSAFTFQRTNSPWTQNKLCDLLWKCPTFPMSPVKIKPAAFMTSPPTLVLWGVILSVSCQESDGNVQILQEHSKAEGEKFVHIILRLTHEHGEPYTRMHLLMHQWNKARVHFDVARWLRRAWTEASHTSLCCCRILSSAIRLTPLATTSLFHFSRPKLMNIFQVWVKTVCSVECYKCNCFNFSSKALNLASNQTGMFTAIEGTKNMRSCSKSTSGISF